MFKRISKVLMMALMCLVSGCQPDEFVQNLPSQTIELSRYLGVWYEIARFPNWFERELVGVTATYSLKDDGNIKVLNQGYRPSLDGERKQAVGTAWVPDATTPGRLKVSFFGPFAADYIVMDIDADYQVALVGSGRDFLWILSRTPQLDPEVYNRLVATAQSLGFDIAKLEKLQQKPD